MPGPLLVDLVKQDNLHVLDQEPDVGCGGVEVVKNITSDLEACVLRGGFLKIENSAQVTGSFGSLGDEVDSNFSRLAKPFVD